MCWIVVAILGALVAVAGCNCETGTPARSAPSDPTAEAAAASSAEIERLEELLRIRQREAEERGGRRGIPNGPVQMKRPGEKPQWCDCDAGSCRCY